MEKSREGNLAAIPFYQPVALRMVVRGFCWGNSLQQHFCTQTGVRRRKVGFGWAAPPWGAFPAETLLGEALCNESLAAKPVRNREMKQLSWSVVERAK